MAIPQCGDKRLRIVGANGSARYIGQKYAVWDGRPARCPKKGELYMSGAPGFECAYEAGADMTHPYFIARPTPVEAVRG